MWGDGNKPPWAERVVGFKRVYGLENVTDVMRALELIGLPYAMTFIEKDSRRRSVADLPDVGQYVSECPDHKSRPFYHFRIMKPEHGGDE